MQYNGEEGIIFWNFEQSIHFLDRWISYHLSNKYERILRTRLCNFEPSVPSLDRLTAYNLGNKYTNSYEAPLSTHLFLTDGYVRTFLLIIGIINCCESVHMKVFLLRNPWKYHMTLFLRVWCWLFSGVSLQAKFNVMDQWSWVCEMG